MSLLSELRDHFEKEILTEGIGPYINLFCDVLHAKSVSNAAQSRLAEHAKKRGMTFWEKFKRVADGESDSEGKYIALERFLMREAPRDADLEPACLISDFAGEPQVPEPESLTS